MFIIITSKVVSTIWITETDDMASIISERIVSNRFTGTWTVFIYGTIQISSLLKVSLYVTLTEWFCHHISHLIYAFSLLYFVVIFATP